MISPWRFSPSSSKNRNSFQCELLWLYSGFVFRSIFCLVLLPTLWSLRSHCCRSLVSSCVRWRNVGIAPRFPLFSPFALLSDLIVPMTTITACYKGLNFLPPAWTSPVTPDHFIQPVHAFSSTSNSACRNWTHNLCPKSGLLLASLSRNNTVSIQSCEPEIWASCRPPLCPLTTHILWISRLGLLPVCTFAFLLPPPHSQRLLSFFCLLQQLPNRSPCVGSGLSLIHSYIMPTFFFGKADLIMLLTEWNTWMSSSVCSKNRNWILWYGMQESMWPGLFGSSPKSFCVPCHRAFVHTFAWNTLLFPFSTSTPHPHLPFALLSVYSSLKFKLSHYFLKETFPNLYKKAYTFFYELS